MRWLIRTAQQGEQGKVISSARTLNEATGLGRNWLDRHTNAQRCYAIDTRGGRTYIINRARTGRRNTGSKTHKDRSI